jgi:transposase-like protein
MKMRYSKEIKQNVVSAIVNGELWLEEAMVKYEVQDRMTIIRWLKKYLMERNNVTRSK